jgi:hypothetical protein
MATDNSNWIDPDWLRQYQERTGTTASDSPALRNAYRQHLFRQRRKDAPLRNAPPEPSPEALAEVEAILAGLPERKRVAIKTAFAEELNREAFAARLAAGGEAERRLDNLTPRDLVERLPPGPETVNALLDILAPGDLEALRNALELKVATFEEINRRFAPEPLRNGKEELELFRAVRDVLIEIMDEDQRAAIVAEALDRLEKSLGTMGA